jgi:hypothetical protein
MFLPWQVPFPKTEIAKTNVAKRTPPNDVGPEIGVVD